MMTNGAFYRSTVSSQEANDANAKQLSQDGANEHYVGQTPQRFESYPQYCTMSENSKKDNQEYEAGGGDRFDGSSRSRRSRA